MKSYLLKFVWKYGLTNRQIRGGHICCTTECRFLYCFILYQVNKKKIDVLIGQFGIINTAFYERQNLLIFLIVHLNSDAYLSLYFAVTEYYLIIQFYLCLHGTSIDVDLFRIIY